MARKVVPKSRPFDNLSMNADEDSLASVSSAAVDSDCLHFEQFAQIPGVKLRRYSGDVSRGSNRRRSTVSACPDVKEIGRLLQMPGVDIVYIATPPFLHFPKPWRRCRRENMSSSKNRRHESNARPKNCSPSLSERGLLFATNLMQRYNPLFDAIQGLLTRSRSASYSTPISKTTPAMSNSRPTIGFGTAAKVAASSSSMASISSTCLPVGSGQARSRPRRSSHATRHADRRSGPVHGALRQMSSSTSIMALLNLAVWIARSCAWFSSAETYGSTNGYPFGRPSKPWSTKPTSARSASYFRRRARRDRVLCG